MNKRLQKRRTRWLALFLGLVLLFPGATTWLSWQGTSGQPLEQVYHQHA